MSAVGQWESFLILGLASDHFGTNETTISFYPWDPGLISGGCFLIPGLWVVGRLGMAPPVIFSPPPPKQEEEIENLETMITPSFPEAVNLHTLIIYVNIIKNKSTKCI